MKTSLVFAMLVGVALAGCKPSAETGPVTAAGQVAGWRSGPAVGLKAPQITFTDAEGKPRLLRTASGWVTLIGFTTAQGKECCSLSPQLTEMASRYWDKPVRVVQVSLPTAECPHGPGCSEACHIKPLHLMALCDGSRIAYDAFGRPKDHTLLLIGGDGRVDAIGTIQDSSAVLTKADELARQAEKKQLPSYLSIY